MNDKLILCQYVNHNVEPHNFTASGLGGIYKICRECNAKKIKRYRQKNKDDYNNRVREYQKQYKRKIRSANKLQEI